MSRILVIDDHPGFRMAVRNILEKEGHEVLEAENGDDGIEQFRAFVPDLIVTDIVMPGKSGIETIRQIRKENSTIRIIAVSGNGGMAADFHTTAREAGANDTISKPFPAKRLFKVIEKP